MPIKFDFRGVTGKSGRATIMKRVAILLQEQTLDRIESGGDDEIRFEPLKFDRPDGSRDRPLWKNGSHLHSSITHGTEGSGVAWVGSTMKGSAVLLLGTVGKRAEGVGQGVKRTIEPKNAKALFIPLSVRAQNAVRIGGKVGARRVVGTKGGKAKKGRRGNQFVDLKKGEDFILVSKVDLPPRPFLRLSKGNLAEIVASIEGKR